MLSDYDAPSPCAYVALGLGARRAKFRGRSWSLPGGSITCVGWDDGRFKTPTFEIPEDEAAAVEVAHGTDSSEYSYSAGRLLLTPDDATPDAGRAWARHTLETLIAIIDFVYPGPWAGLRIFELWGVGADEAASGTIDVREALEEITGDLWYNGALRAEAVVGSDRVTIAALNALSGVLLSDLDHCLIFWQAGLSSRAFIGGDVPLVMARPHEIAEARTEQVETEGTLQNYYKALEDLVGRRLPNSRPRFLDTLTNAGVDINARLTFPGESAPDYDGPPVTVGERLWRVFSNRNSKAAHGYSSGPTRAPITVYEVMEAQYASHWAISDVLAARGVVFEDGP